MKRTIIVLIAALLSLPCLMAGNKQSETYNIQKAIEAIQNQDYDTAIDALNSELENDSKNGYAYLWAAVIYSAQSDDAGSVLSYSDKALQYLPKKDNEYRSAAFNLRAEAYNNLGNQDKALADISEAIKLSPKDVDLLNYRHQIYYEQERYDLALADAKKITELDPANPLGFIAIGRLAGAQKDYTTALTNYDYAIKLQSDNSACYSFRADTYADMKRWGDAVDDMITALSLDENDEVALDVYREVADSATTVMKTKLKIQSKKEANKSVWPYLVGNTNLRESNYREAAKYFEKSYQIEPNIQSAYSLSICYNYLGKVDKAVDYADRILQMDSTDNDALYCKALAYYENCRWAEAEKMLNDYIDAEPDNANCYRMRATARLHLKNNDGALEDINTALTLDDKPNTLARAGRIYWAIGDKTTAKGYFEKAIAADTLNSYTYLCIYADGYLGRFDEAKRAIEESLPSANDGDLYNFACYYALFGDKQEAITMLNKAVDKGFSNLNKLEGDTDLDSLRQLDGFKKVVERVKALNAEDEAIDAEYSEETVEVPMTKDSGVYKVKCNINGLPLHFVFDTGASDITMSSVEATFMLKNNYISAKDVIGTKNYQTANGDIIEGTMLNLRSVNFGGLNMENVKASVVKTQNAPLLLGQSVLSRLGKVEIDYAKNMLRITHRVKKQ